MAVVIGFMAIMAVLSTSVPLASAQVSASQRGVAISPQPDWLIMDSPTWLIMDGISRPGSLRSLVRRFRPALATLALWRALSPIAYAPASLARLWALAAPAAA